MGTARNFITLTDTMADAICRLRPGVRARAGYVSFDDSLLSREQADEHYILCFGRIDIRMKGIDILVDAFEAAAAQFPRLRLIIAGRGKESDMAWLTRRIGSSAAKNRIEVLTNVSDEEKRELFRGATFVCMPSRFEGWNIAAIEAAAASKATLGTRIHGLSDAIRENETGILVEPENPAALGEKMLLLLRDERLRQKLGRAGYDWAAHFTLARVVAIQEEFYASVAAQS